MNLLIHHRASSKMAKSCNLFMQYSLNIHDDQCYNSRGKLLKIATWKVAEPWGSQQVFLKTEDWPYLGDF